MPTDRDLAASVERIDGQGYRSYKQIKGRYDFGDFVLVIDHVQGDPFAQPSRLRAIVPQTTAKIPPKYFSSFSREVGLRDFLTRQFSSAVTATPARRRGSGKSGLIVIDRPPQEILERTSVMVDNREVEARFLVGLPADGRRILGNDAKVILTEIVPEIVRKSLIMDALDDETLQTHVWCNEDQDALRDQLDRLGLLAFIPNNARLPRRSGIDPTPMPEKGVMVFKAPPTMEVSVIVPHLGEIKGLGIKKGVTLIVGGGYHGKSTLMQAIQLGVYNHIPGDGREMAVTTQSAVKIRAEDGRSVTSVGVTPFISNLPVDKDTDRFTTEDASGSTSQAANIIEALEIGAEALLIDEDTSATNFMIRDHRMQELVAKDKEPITPFIDNVRQIYDELGVSTLLVIGGSGDYFDVADSVIMMDEYLPQDVTDEALAVAKKHPTARQKESGSTFGTPNRRVPDSTTFDASAGRRDDRVRVRGLRTIEFGRREIDLTAVEQIVDDSQLNAIGDAILYCRDNLMDVNQSMADILRKMDAALEKNGLDVLSPYPVGHFSRFRRFELAAAINRLRSMKVLHIEIH